MNYAQEEEVSFASLSNDDDDIIDEDVAALQLQGQGRTPGGIRNEEEASEDHRA